MVITHNTNTKRAGSTGWPRFTLRRTPRGVADGHQAAPLCRGEVRSLQHIGPSFL
jgi:hypothetical protein